ncbi:MAG: phenylalanine--tRNA ligase subunit beta [Pseudomonadota bacterium]
MKFSISWLKKHLDTDASLADIVDTMVKIGLEVEEVINPADALSAISVGHVIHAEQHPDADKLRVCRVDTKDGEQQIVCGAPNARKGIKVAFAPVGTYISGIDVTLSKAKIRGVESFGMMCSAKELELGDDHDGIIELPQDAPIGASLVDVLNVDDPVIDFEVTPNRPDTNGIDGIARDLAAAGLGTLITKEPSPLEGVFNSTVPVIIEDEETCPAFASRTIRGLKNGPSPKWLQDALKAVGLRPINALVDVTNYLSYDRARPLHVYDISKLNGPIHVRRGNDGESFLALDGKEYNIDDSMCVIADDEKVLGLGGIMGGETSSSTEDTVDVLVECALFDPLRTARTGRKTGIVSDARYRFERGVDPASVLPGIELATSLILDICGGEPSTVSLTGTIPTLENTPENTIEFPPSEVERLTGMNIADGEKEAILTGLGFDVTRGGIWRVRAPSFRPDIEGKADLVEEISRIHGLDHLPTDALPQFDGKPAPKVSQATQMKRNAASALAKVGYQECVTWAFCDAKIATLFGGSNAPALSNPISSDLGMMRPSALPNLVSAIGRNAARGASYARLFEIGGRYEDDTPKGQKTVLSAVAFGALPKNWQGDSEQPTVFDAKSVALSALAAAGVSVQNLTSFATGPDYYHPGRKGSLGLGPKKILAHFGEVHPGVLKKMNVPGPIVAMEVFFDDIPAPRAKAGKTKAPLTLSNLMPLTRDFAFVVDADKGAEALLKAVRGAEKNLITDVRLFDVYDGKGMPKGKKSLAVEVTLQPKDKTLNDDDIEAVSNRIIAQAEKAVGASLRTS